MKKPLLDTIFASEKRKEVLLLLQDGVKEMEELLKVLDTTRTSLLPQIRVLEEHHLVTHKKEIYGLTTLGKLIVDKVSPVTNKIDFFDTDIDYWGTHKLDFIPHHLLERIDELEKCRIINPRIPDIYAHPQEIYGAMEHLKASLASKDYFGMTNYFYPDYNTRFSEMAQSYSNVNLIITKGLFNKFQSVEYKGIRKFVENEIFHFYLYPHETDFVSFGTNEQNLIMRLFNEKGEYDNKYILCSSPKVLDWGKELFDHYLKDSVLITET